MLERERQEMKCIRKQQNMLVVNRRYYMLFSKKYINVEKLKLQTYFRTLGYVFCSFCWHSLPKRMRRTTISTI